MKRSSRRSLCEELTNDSTLWSENSAPDDAYEREADRVADQVMRMPELSTRGHPGSGRREARFQRLNGS